MHNKYGKIIMTVILAVLCLALFAACDKQEEVSQTKPVMKVMLNITEYNFTDPDESIRLSAVVLPDDADDKTITWSNSDPNVVSINDDYTSALNAK